MRVIASTTNWLWATCRAHVIQGRITVNNTVLNTGDAAGLSGEKSLNIVGTNSKRTEIPVCDLA